MTGIFSKILTPPVDDITNYWTHIKIKNDDNFRSNDNKEHENL